MESARDKRTGDMFRTSTIALLLAFSCGGAFAGDGDNASLGLEKAMQALEQPRAEEKQAGVEYVLRHSDSTPSIALFLAAAAAYRLGRLEDAAFLFYAGKLRARLDMERFVPVGTGGDSPGVAMAALSQSLGGAINPAIMRHPAAYANVVKRLESWDPYAKAPYTPGWKYAKTLPEKVARARGEKYKADYLSAARGMSALLNNAEYFQAFLVVQQFKFSSYQERQRPDLIEKKDRAEQRLREIEEKMGIEGLYFRKKRP